MTRKNQYLVEILVFIFCEATSQADMLLSIHLQNSTYPAARHTQNNITLSIDVEGIRRIKNIPIAAQSNAKPIIRFIIRILTAVVTFTLSYAV